MRKVFTEFRQFAIRGNVIDLAVGVIIGGAFGKIVTSLVDDLIMPPIGLLLGEVDFRNLYVVMKPGEKLPPPYASVDQAKASGAVVWSYGLFINQVVQFVIMAFAVFMLVRAINRLKAKIEEPEVKGEPVTKQCPYCLSEIPFKAQKCGHCTSDLPVMTAAGRA